MRSGSAKSTAREADDAPPMITFALLSHPKNERISIAVSYELPGSKPVSLAEPAVLTVTGAVGDPDRRATRVRTSTTSRREGPRHGAAAGTERGRARVAAAPRQHRAAAADHPKTGASITTPADHRPLTSREFSPGTSRENSSGGDSGKRHHPPSRSLHGSPPASPSIKAAVEKRSRGRSQTVSYNGGRFHQALGDRSPLAVWREGVTGALAGNAVDMTLSLDNADALPTCPQRQQPQQQQMICVA